MATSRRKQKTKTALFVERLANKKRFFRTFSYLNDIAFGHKIGKEMADFNPSNKNISFAWEWDVAVNVLVFLHS